MAPSSTSRLLRQFRATPRPLINPVYASSLQHAGRPGFFSNTPHAANSNPQKDAQLDREKMNTDANEYSKSGTDDTASANEEAAFDTDAPRPEGAKEKAGKGNDVNPLDASPANQEISQPTREQEGGAKKKVSEGGGGRN